MSLTTLPKPLDSPPVEHHIGGIKRSRIVHDTYRNRKDDYVDLVMETACGLHNFRVSQRMMAVA